MCVCVRLKTLGGSWDVHREFPSHFPRLRAAFSSYITGYRHDLPFLLGASIVLLLYMQVQRDWRGVSSVTVLVYTFEKLLFAVVFKQMPPSPFRLLGFPLDSHSWCFDVYFTLERFFWCNLQRQLLLPIESAEHVPEQWLVCECVLVVVGDLTVAGHDGSIKTLPLLHARNIINTIEYCQYYWLLFGYFCDKVLTLSDWDLEAGNQIW